MISDSEVPLKNHHEGQGNTIALTDRSIHLAAKAIAKADGLLVTAGAGMGVDSGLPDFRGKEGFWEAYPALARAGLGFTSIANPAEFVSNPRRAWGFYGHRLRLYRETEPHPGFAILKMLSHHMAHGVFVFTSNVDGQFQKAGFDPERIVEAHGSIHHLQCLKECRSELWSAEGFDPVVDNERCELLSDFPHCPHCGGIARPNILMFGDGYWLNSRARIQTVAMKDWLKKVQNLVVIEIGAGSDIPTVRYQSENVGGTLIRINPREPESDYEHTLSIPLGGLDALQKIQASPDLNNLTITPYEPITQNLENTNHWERLMNNLISGIALTLDFGEVGYHYDQHPFSCRLDGDLVADLLNSVSQAHRIYELMLIKRYGDIWDYIQVTPVQTPPNLASRLPSRRKQEGVSIDSPIALKAFDRLFWACGDDTDPVDEAWLHARDSKLVQDFARFLFSIVQDAQETISHDRTLLVKHELHLVHQHQHPYDLLDRGRAIVEDRDSPPTKPIHTQAFYRTLDGVLNDMQLVCVAYRGKGDYQIIRLLCEEQRRRADLSGHKAGNALTISALTSIVNTEAWGAQVAFYGEGIGYGDLFIEDGSNRTGVSLANLFGKYYTAPGCYILTSQDQGELNDYTKEQGEGWFLYKRIVPYPRRFSVQASTRVIGVPKYFSPFHKKGGAAILKHEQLLIIVGKTLSIADRDALATLLLAYGGGSDQPLCVILGESEPFIQRSVPGVHVFYEGASGIEPKNWLLNLVKHQYQWLDAAILLNAPDWVEDVVATYIDQEDGLWNPYVLTNQSLWNIKEFSLIKDTTEFLA